MDVTLDIDLGTKLGRLTKSQRRSLDQFVEEGLDDAGRMLEARVKARTPIDTGRLRASIGYELVGSGVLKVGSLFASSGIGGATGNPVEYAVYVEFGTRKMRAQPFLFPTVEGSFPAIVKEIDAALERGLRSILG